MLTQRWGGGMGSPGVLSQYIRSMRSPLFTIFCPSIVWYQPQTLPTICICLQQQTYLQGNKGENYSYGSTNLLSVYKTWALPPYIRYGDMALKSTLLPCTYRGKDSLSTTEWQVTECLYLPPIDPKLFKAGRERLG